VTPATRIGSLCDGGCEGAILAASTPVNKVGKMGKIQRGLIESIESLAPLKIIVYWIMEDDSANAA
jgi:hypothetical protein